MKYGSNVLQVDNFTFLILSVNSCSIISSLYSKMVMNEPEDEVHCRVPPETSTSNKKTVCYVLFL